jgi:hypothetical protein
MRQLTRDEAIELAESHFWEDIPIRDAARLQLYQDKLCMPFDVFHEGTEKLLGRPVWSHEFAFPDLLRAEMEGKQAAPTLDEIINLIPPEKRVVMVVRDDRD